MDGKVSGWRVVNECWKLNVGGRKVEVGGWRVEYECWRVKYGELLMNGGG